MISRVAACLLITNFLVRAFAATDVEKVVTGFVRQETAVRLDAKGSNLEFIRAENGRSSWMVTWRDDGGHESVSMSKEGFFKAQGWFVYIESASRIWLFDGVRQLDLLHRSPGRIDRQSIVAKSLFETRPQEVWDALPQSAKDYLREQHQAELKTAREWWFTANSPVIAYWDGGDLWSRKQPSIIFALWSDGMFVRAADGRLLKGYVEKHQIQKLMADVEAAGFFSYVGSNLIDNYGLVFPDGPVRCLAAVRDGNVVRRYYHGDDDFKSASPFGDPSRRQMETFANIWRSVVAVIASVKSSEMTAFRSERVLTYPGNDR
jgi:hypothetical protein